MHSMTCLRWALLALPAVCATATIVSARDVSIRCVVSDTKGQPIDAAQVVLQVVHRLHPVVRDEDRLLAERTHSTDRQGRCQTDAIVVPTAADPLWLYLQVVREGFVDVHKAVRINSKWIGSGSPAPVRIELKRGQTVRGRVVDPQGRPIANAEVFAAATTPAFDCSPRQTDASGEFQLCIPEEAAHIVAVVQAKDHAPHRETIFVGAAGLHEIVLRQGTRVSGQLLDVAGRPLGGYYVLARQTGTGHPVVTIVAQTSPAGAFDLGFLRGDFVISTPRHVRRWSTEVHAHAPEPPAVIKPRAMQAADSQALEITLKSEPTATLTGRITDDQGRPVAGQVVTILANVTKPGAESLLEYVVTDATGRYRSRCVPIQAENVFLAPVGIRPLEGGLFLRAKAAAHVQAALPTGDAVQLKMVAKDVADIDFQFLPWAPGKGFIPMPGGR